MGAPGTSGLPLVERDAIGQALALHPNKALPQRKPALTGKPDRGRVAGVDHGHHFGEAQLVEGEGENERDDFGAHALSPAMALQHVADVDLVHVGDVVQPGEADYLAVRPTDPVSYTHLRAHE